MPGMVDTPASQDNSSLRGIIDKPPGETRLHELTHLQILFFLVGGKELAPLNQLQLSGFRLHPGPLPDSYRVQTQAHPRKNKHKRRRERQSAISGPGAAGVEAAGDVEPSSSGRTDEEREKRREKKHKKHDKDAEERKKKKKEKKRKKNREDKDL